MNKLRQDITRLTESMSQRDVQLKAVQDDLVKVTNESKQLQENFEKVRNTLNTCVYSNYVCVCFLRYIIIVMYLIAITFVCELCISITYVL